MAGSVSNWLPEKCVGFQNFQNSHCYLLNFFKGSAILL